MTGRHTYVRTETNGEADRKREREREGGREARSRVRTRQGQTEGMMPERTQCVHLWLCLLILCSIYSNVTWVVGHFDVGIFKNITLL